MNPMKTVAGRVISSEPISVSKAASILSKFASSDNGATQAISAYLRRASAAFNELKSLHKDLKVSSVKEKKPRSGDATIPDGVSRDGGQKKKQQKKEKQSDGVGGRESEIVGEEEPVRGREHVSEGPSKDEEIERKESKKKTNKKNRGEAKNIDDGKAITEVKTKDENRNEKKEEKKRRKRESGKEMDLEEKKSKKKTRV